MHRLDEPRSARARRQPTGAALAMAAAVAAAVTLTACDPSAGDDDVTGDDDDATHDTGCITVDGEVPGYARLQDAVDAAPSGAVISVCPGVYEGSTRVEKSLSILGEDPATTTLVGDVNEMTLSIRAAADVLLSGFTLETTRNAVRVEDSTGVALEHLVVGGSGQVALQLSGSEVSIADAVLTGHPRAAIDAEDSTVDIATVDIADGEGYGVRLVGSQGIICDSSIARIAVPDPSDERDGSCIFADTGSGALTVDDVDLDTCGRAAVYAVDTDVTVSGCTVADSPNGVAGVGAPTGSAVLDCQFDQVPLFGVLLVGQDAEVSGNNLAVSDPGDNTFGIAVGAPDGTFVVSDNVVSGYGRTGIWVQYPYDDPAPTGGTATLEGNTITAVDLYGVLVTDLDVADVSFNDVSAVRWSGALSQGSYGDGFGIGLWTIDALTLSSNRVHDVDVVGLFLQDTAFTSSDDQLDDNLLWAAYVGESSGTFDQLLVEHNAIYGLDARTSDVTLVDAVFRDTHRGVPPELWEDPDPYEYPAYATSFSESQAHVHGTRFTESEDTHLSALSTDLDVDGCTFDGPASYGVYGQYAFGTIAGSTFEDAGDAVYLIAIDPDEQLGALSIEDNAFVHVGNGVYGSYLAGTLTITGNEFSATVDAGGGGSDGYGVYAVDYLADGARVELVDNTFADLDNSALLAHAVALDVHGANAIDTVDNGRSAVRLEQVAGTVEGLSIQGASGRGLEADASDLTLSACSIVDSLDHNLWIRDSAVEITGNLALSQGAQSGVWLEGTVTGRISGNAIEDNAAYGIDCESAGVVLDECVNTMDGNALGDFKQENGCVLGCTAL